MRCSPRWRWWEWRRLPQRAHPFLWRIRKALPEPDQSRPDLGTSYVAPSTRLEEVLCAIWAEVLDVEREVNVAIWRDHPVRWSITTVASFRSACLSTLVIASCTTR